MNLKKIYIILLFGYMFISNFIYISSPIYGGVYVLMGGFRALRRARFSRRFSSI